MPVSAPAVILDTNVFVAAAFRKNSVSARIVEKVRSGRLRLIWNEETRRETEHVLTRIPPVSWRDVAGLFRDEDRFEGETAPQTFDYIQDPDDRKYAALAAAAGVVLVSSDDHLLSNRDRGGLQILTPGEFWKQQFES